MIRQQRVGYLAALAVVAIATSFMLISRLGGKSALNEWDVFALRLATASILLLPFAGRLPAGCWRDRRLWILTLSGGVGYGVLIYAGFKFAPAAHAAILYSGLQPFLVALAAWCLIGQRPASHRWCGYALIGAGLVFAAVPVMRGDWQPAQLIGDALFVAASIMWAIYTVLARRWGYSPWTLTCFVALGSALVWLPVYALLLPKQLAEAPLSMLITQGVFQGAGPAILAMALFLKAVASIGAARTGAMMALVPVLAGATAVPLLDEPLTGWMLAGLLTVTLGTYLAVREPRPV